MIRAGAFLGVAVVVDRTLGARVLAAAEAGAGAGGCHFFCEILRLTCSLSLHGSY